MGNLILLFHKIKQDELKNIIFSYAKENDLTEIAKLSKMLAILECEFDNKINPDWEIEGFLQKRLKNGVIENITVAKINNKIIGYFVVEEKEEEEYLNTALYVFLEIEEMFILPEYRGYGIGAKMLNLIDEYAKKIGLKVRVKASFLNKKAIKFYKKHGFMEYDLILEN